MAKGEYSRKGGMSALQKASQRSEHCRDISTQITQKLFKTTGVGDTSRNCRRDVQIETLKGRALNLNPATVEECFWALFHRDRLKKQRKEKT
jgi:hypothetical protein